MKKVILVLFFMVAAGFAGAQSIDRQIQKLALDITRSYVDASSEQLLKPRIGIADFADETEDAAKYSVGALTAAMLTDKFSRSTVFTVIERKNLDALMKEYKLSLSGLTSDSTAPELGMLQGIELLLLGSVSGVGDRYVITARLVDVETGRIISGSRIEVDRREIERESEQYMMSTFQSPYGIILAPSEATMWDPDKSTFPFMMITLDAGYRIRKWLALSLGYVHFYAGEIDNMDTDRITVTTSSSDDYSVTRYFNFIGDGVKIGATASISPGVRFSLGIQTAAILYFRAHLEQDLPDFPVWQINEDGTIGITTNRIIVTGFAHELYASYLVSLEASYLLSSRFSIFGRIGGFLFPDFTPTSFYSFTSVRDSTIVSDATIDQNGTFPEYQGYNFSRTSDGSRVSFSSMGGYLQLGVAFNF